MNTQRAPLRGRRLALGLSLWLAVGPLSAQTINSATTIANLTLNPNASVSRTGTVRVQCNGYIGTFTLALTLLSVLPDPGSFPLTFGFWQPGNSPQYQLSTNGTATRADEVLQGTFPPGSGNNTRITLRYAVVIPAGSLPLPGTYAVSYRFDLYASDLPLAGSPVTSRTLAFNIVVGNRFDLAVVPSGSAFNLGSTSATLAFGELTEGALRGVDLIARTNVNYTLSLRSTKGGFLDHADPLEESIVPYVLTVDDKPVTLPAGVAVPITDGETATGIGGKRFPLTVTISPQEFLPAEGSYSDTFALSISAP